MSDETETPTAKREETEKERIEREARELAAAKAKVPREPRRHPAKRLRHWKQRFDRNAKFVWGRSVIYEGERTVPGEPVPISLEQSPTKLRRFWESQTIHLADFSAPDVTTGTRRDARQTYDGIELPAGVEVVAQGKGWYELRYRGEFAARVRGADNLRHEIEVLRNATTRAGE